MFEEHSLSLNLPKCCDSKNDHKRFSNTTARSNIFEVSVGRLWVNGGTAVKVFFLFHPVKNSCHPSELFSTVFQPFDVSDLTNSLPLFNNLLNELSCPYLTCHLC